MRSYQGRDGPVKLDEYTKDEWYDVWRKFKPDAPREEYDAAWQRFCEIKAEYKRNLQLQ